MATVYEKDLMAALSREVGDTDTSNLYYNSDALFSAINDGLADYNEEMFQQYTVVGSGSNAYFSPDPDTDDQRLIILYSARTLMRAELVKTARTAIVHTNPAGRTDLTARPQAVELAIQRYDKMIAKLKYDRSRALVDDKLDDDGAQEIKNKTTSSTTYVEGLPTTTITTST